MKKGLLWLSIAILLFGAGCAWFSDNKSTGPRPAGPYPAELKGVTPEEASKRINFVPGSQIEISQLSLDRQGSDITSDQTDNKNGIRIITLKRFAPFYFANINWKISESIAEERETFVGSIKDFELGKSHELFLPSYWPTEDVTVADNGGIWLSKEVYQELIATKNSTIYYNLLNSLLYDKLSASPEFATAVKALEADTATAKKTLDVDLTKADDQMIDWPIKVNGEQVVVQAIKARNWFGEIIVLNNVQNPLILKMTFDPQLTEALNQETGLNLLKSLLSFEVTEMNGVQ